MKLYIALRSIDHEGVDLADGQVVPGHLDEGAARAAALKFDGGLNYGIVVAVETHEADEMTHADWRLLVELAQRAQLYLRSRDRVAFGIMDTAREVGVRMLGAFPYAAHRR